MADVMKVMFQLDSYVSIKKVTFLLIFHVKYISLTNKRS